jgi:tyrosinase
MTKSELPRRDFLAALGIAGGLSLLGASETANAQPPILGLQRKCPQPGAIIRKNIKNLAAAELTAFRAGVAAMKARGTNDPTSWTYQAAIHGTTLSGSNVAWNTCQHNTTFFFSWHRMYLCFFERILRKASGNANFGLPYWNYSDAADLNARALPSAFRTPVVGNSLFESNRGTGINTGSLISASAVGTATALANTSFYPFSSSCNGTPHGAVHGALGGLMGSVPTAAQDPIFWLHHCNIDRLWNRWLSQGGGRQNPTTDATWLYTEFTFFDENKKQVKMTGADIINANCNMCKSCYDEEAVFPDWTVAFDNLVFAELQIGRGRPITLSAEPLRFELELDDEVKKSLARVSSLAKPNAASLKLSFEDVRMDRGLDFYFEVYLDLPAGTDPDFRMSNYAGNIALFGADRMHDHDMKRGAHKFSVNISEAVGKLSSRSLDSKRLSVTLVPTATETREGKRIPVRSNAKAEVGRVTLAIEEGRR